MSCVSDAFKFVVHKRHLIFPSSLSLFYHSQNLIGVCLWQLQRICIFLIESKLDSKTLTKPTLRTYEEKVKSIFGFIFLLNKFSIFCVRRNFLHFKFKCGARMLLKLSPPFSCSSKSFSTGNHAPSTLFRLQLKF